MNDIGRIGGLDYKNSIPRVLKTIDPKELDSLVMEINDIERDSIDISAFSKAINRLLDEMEIELREAILTSLIVEDRLDLNQETVVGLEDLEAKLDRLEEENPAYIEVLEDFKELIKSNRRELIKFIRFLDFSRTENKIDDINIRERIGKSEVMRTREGLVDRLEKTLAKLDNFIDSIFDLGNEGLDLKKEPDIIFRDNKEKMTLLKKLDQLVSFFKEEEGELVEILEKSQRDQNRLETDTMFRKFKIDGDRDFRENIYMEVFKSREEVLKKLEDDLEIKKIYREGRKDLNLSLKLLEILRLKDFSFREVVYFGMAMLVLGLILNRII